MKPGDSAAKVAREQFNAAKVAAPSVPWLAHLARGEADDEDGKGEGVSLDTKVQVERLESVLLALGTASNYKFEKLAKKILESLSAPNSFEEGQRQLGKLLGFIAGNNESDAAPDPWWLGETVGLVFEDHAGAKATSTLGANKAQTGRTSPRLANGERARGERTGSDSSVGDALHLGQQGRQACPKEGPILAA